MANEDRCDDESYRVITFHPHRGAPPTMGTADLHTTSHHQVAMRALPDLPDDPGALPLALSTDELVDALGSICAHLDEDKPPSGSAGLHDDQITIHWYLRDPAEATNADWLPPDVHPDHVVVWWATASPTEERRFGQVGTDRLCRRLLLPGIAVASPTTDEDRLVAALAALEPLATAPYDITAVAAMTHEGAAMGMGPSRHLRVAQAAATASGREASWADATCAAVAHADAIASDILPPLSGHDHDDPRRSALSDALIGWVTGMTLAPYLRHQDLSHLIAPVAAVLRPEHLPPLDLDDRVAEFLDAVFASGPDLLRQLEPAETVIDQSTVTRARRRLHTAIACEWFRSLQLTATRREDLATLVPDPAERQRLRGVLTDLCAVFFCDERDLDLEVLRPIGLPDPLWERWLEGPVSDAH